MNRYEYSTPRAALGLTAVAMTAITMGALVVLPAKLDSVGEAEPMPDIPERSFNAQDRAIAVRILAEERP